MFRYLERPLILKRTNRIAKATVCILFFVQIFLFLPYGFANNSTMQMRSIIVSTSSEQAEILSESKDPIKSFAGKDITGVGPLELAGIFALLTNDSFNEVMARFNNFDPDYGDEDGPWLVNLPIPLTERFANLTEDDLERLSEEWDNFKEMPENANVASIDPTFEQVKEMMLSIKKICSESVSTKNDVFLWIHLEF